MIYVYAITDGPPAPLEEPLRALEHGSLAAVFRPATAEDRTPNEEALWAHETVLEALMKERAVLPLRFGSVLADEAELGELLVAREREFAASLGQVRGRVELGVRATLPASVKPARPLSGSEYLQGKLERRRVASELGAVLNAELASAACAATYRTIADPRPEFAGAYLVEREQVERFRKQVEALRRERPDVEVACTGPWPPFSFAEPTGAA